MKIKLAAIRIALIFCIIASASMGQSEATGCGCSANKPANQEHAHHECTCKADDKSQNTHLQKILSYFKGIYLRAGLEMRRYTKAARSNGRVGFVAGIGYHIPEEPMRIEFLIQHNTVNFRANTPALRAKARTFFINGYYDIIYEKLQAKHLTPYFTVGAGQTKYYNGSLGYSTVIEVAPGKFMPETLYQSKVSKTKTAWNMGIGLKYDLNKNIAIDASYSYLVLGKFVHTNHIKGYQCLISALLTL